MTRILIKHSTGSKANRIEQFSIESSDEISLGRDPGATVTYDPEKDDLVSRRHALIRVRKGDELSFTIEDPGSSNGTLVNGERISPKRERELLPGDEVELGAGGPKFTFDVEPRPPHLVARTRMMTRAAETPEPPPEAVTAAGGATGEPAPYKVGVGRSTVLDMLSQQLRSQLPEQLRLANRTWMYALAGVLALVAIVGAGLYYQNVVAAKRVTAKLAETSSKFGTMTTKDIAAKYADATVLIDFTWRLYHRGSGKQVFHRFKTLPNNTAVPTYVRLANQKVVRWLVTNDQNQTNKPIQGIGYGSGFVVERTGLILTNKHVAARWSTPYGLNYYEDRCNNCARIFDQDEVDTGPGKEAGKPFTPTSDDLYDWIPGEEGLLFKENKAEVIDGPKKTQQGLSEGAFEGRSEQLDVHFSGQNMSVPARFIRASLEADMALAKIDIPFNLKTAAMIDELKDQPPTQGDRVAVLGYPDISQRTYSTTVSLEAGQPKPRVSMIPEPTITDGIISSIGRGIEPVKGTWLNMTYGSVGDVYQLTVNTGQGNSGGPVIDSTGKVIAIFTYAVVNRNGDKVTYAVPIKYGKQLMELQGRLD